MRERTPTVVIVGGGFGDLVAAKALRNTPAQADHYRSEPRYALADAPPEVMVSNK